VNAPLRIWRKSSYSTPDGQCIEIADTSEGIDLRDSKDPTGPVLRFDRSCWMDFLGTIKLGGLGGHKTTSCK
jgi:hypothetical protein